MWTSLDPIVFLSLVVGVIAAVIFAGGCFTIAEDFQVAGTGLNGSGVLRANSGTTRLTGDIGALIPSSSPTDRAKLLLKFTSLEIPGQNPAELAALDRRCRAAVKAMAVAERNAGKGKSTKRK